MKKMTLFERFEKHTQRNPENGCLEWTGALNHKGYGLITVRGPEHKSAKSTGVGHLTHRLQWMLCFGPIPDHLCVLHTCDNPCCVEPTHLWLGTHQDNSNDKVAKGRDRHPSGAEHVMSRAIVCEDGREWPTSRAASIDLNVTQPAVSNSIIRGHRCAGLRLNYKED